MFTLVGIIQHIPVWNTAPHNMHTLYILAKHIAVRFKALTYKNNIQKTAHVSNAFLFLKNTSLCTWKA